MKASTLLARAEQRQIMRTFARRVRGRRRALGIPLLTLSQRTGISRNTLYAIEQGTRKNVTLATVITLATALRCSVFNLLVDSPWAV